MDAGYYGWLYQERKDERDARLLLKYPREKWNKRLRNLDERIRRRAESRARWEVEYAKQRAEIDAQYSKLDDRIAAADAEWDRNHYWDEERQEWRRK